MAAATYAVVQDVPASWETYRRAVATLGEALPEGLIVHIAGPTEEGFRVIDVWESRRDWETFRDERLPELLRTIRTTMRDLEVQHLYLA
jgi:hypothetical protein